MNANIAEGNRMHFNENVKAWRGKLADEVFDPISRKHIELSDKSQSTAMARRSTKPSNESGFLDRSASWSAAVIVRTRQEERHQRARLDNGAHESRGGAIVLERPRR